MQCKVVAAEATWRQKAVNQSNEGHIFDGTNVKARYWGHQLGNNEPHSIPRGAPGLERDHWSRRRGPSFVGADFMEAIDVVDFEICHTLARRETLKNIVVRTAPIGKGPWCDLCRAKRSCFGLWRRGVSLFCANIVRGR
jgi:hypothetical protein